VLPPIAFVVTLRVCRELRERDRHPLRGWEGAVVRRTPEGGFEVVPGRDDRVAPEDRG
jgi:hypothetical protein